MYDSWLLPLMPGSSNTMGWVVGSQAGLVLGCSAQSRRNWPPSGVWRTSLGFKRDERTKVLSGIGLQKSTLRLTHKLCSSSWVCFEGMLYVKQ